MILFCVNYSQQWNWRLSQFALKYLIWIVSIFLNLGVNFKILQLFEFWANLCMSDNWNTTCSQHRWFIVTSPYYNWKRIERSNNWRLTTFKKCYKIYRLISILQNLSSSMLKMLSVFKTETILCSTFKHQYVGCIYLVCAIFWIDFLLIWQLFIYTNSFILLIYSVTLFSILTNWLRWNFFFSFFFLSIFAFIHRLTWHY